MDHKSELDKLQNHLGKTEDLLKKAGDSSELDELRKIFRRPGWTTPAEWRFTVTLIDALQDQLKNVIALKSGLVKAANLVGEEVHA